MLVEVDSWKQAKNILKGKTFNTTKYRTYSQKNLNTSKGVIKSRELALATKEEMSAALEKQGFQILEELPWEKAEKKLKPTPTSLTFNQLHIHKEVKIGYCLQGVEQYVPAPLRCFKFQKCGHHREACRGRQTCAKCGEKD